ncbi:protein disabled isoform X2 [Armigeres subalbatus]|uniref:protein disabled isoform X2 n=1 Tax=Armigeres subalbatus TaxID=124917 RepID=UPI002ED06012
MQTLRKKTSPLKYRNEPGRFFGDGVSFKAKLIGILEVGEARGDRMCQEALQDLKMAIRAAGEHKQRITIHVTIDGLRLRDEKTGDSLYHHPVHKISFIAQDMTDSRAFGYIFGSPDSGHRFFGIKTDKAASQVVLAMRDLFQVVFELKKKEIELARQHIQSKITAHEHQAVAMAVKSTDGYGKSLTTDGTSSSFASSSLCGAIGGSSSKAAAKCEKSPESVADLVDLEQELSSIQRGITQMERITPSEVPSKSVIDDDPFGDSFTNVPPAYNLLPPPESSKRHQKQTHKSTENLPATETSSAVPSSSPPAPPTASTPAPQTVAIPPPPSSSTPAPTTGGSTMSSSNSNQNDDWLNSPPNTSRFDPDPVKYSDELNLSDDGFKQSYSTTPQPSSYTDAFTDLDPLGTGKIKPYIDKKYFFQELKNPPKKVLKDLSGQDSSFNANFSSEDLQRQSPQTLPKDSNEMFNPTFDEGPPRSKDQRVATDFSDPFTNKSVDPFMDDDDFSKLHIDPFEMKFSRNTSPRQVENKSGDEILVKSSSKSETSKSDESPVAYNGPLQVNLPPESWAHYISQKRLERQNSDSISPGTGVSSVARNRPNVFKQNTVDVISSISSSSKKMKPNLFGQKFSKRDSNSINMRRLQESDSLSENEAAPEPPPRPDSGSHIEPPPLPPKKQFADIVIRPTPRSGPTTNSSSSGSTKERYDYVAAKFESKGQPVSDAPPLPLPSRKVNRHDSSSPGRPFKKLTDEDDYLQPIPAKSEIPTLLPPPQRKDASKTRAARKSETDPRNLDEPTPPAHSKSPTVRDTESLLPDITLSQLLTLGIDELATKLNVPVTKLSTMTLVELTSYLSEFIEKSKTSPSSATSWNQEAENNDSPVFKVNFDDHNDATFIAKFDDNFGEDNTFVANFDNMNLQSTSQASTQPSSNVPVIDKYAVFREIIEQEIGPDQQTADPEKAGLDLSTLDFDREVASEMNRLSPNITGDQFSISPSQMQSFSATSPVPAVPMTKIDTKITEVISQAKDRYAALRDIILVEDLFEKPIPPSGSSAPIARMESSSFEDQTMEDEHRFEANFDDMPQMESHSPEINISDADNNDDYPPMEEIYVDATLLALDQPESHSMSFRNTPKEDLEIDAFMQKAVSNLSLHSTGQQSPGPTQTTSGNLTIKSPQLQSISTSPMRPLQSKSPVAEGGNLAAQNASVENLARATLNDMSTSPIPLSKPSTAVRGTGRPSPLAKSPMDVTFADETSSNAKKSTDSLQKRSSGSQSDGGETSPEADRNQDAKASKLTPTNANESWAVFDQPAHPPAPKKPDGGRLPKGADKPSAESPCSSDPKDEWKNEREYARRWPTKGHTSSSSRDVSPWDEDGPEYRKRPPSQHHPPTSGERYHHPRMPPRRINSNDEDYEDDMKDRCERRRRMKGGQMSSRSRDNFDDEHWYHERQSWSPTEEDERPDRSRSFDRNAYERSTYGPPYEKREPKSLPPYDRRDYKNYDKRKYYRERARPNYDYDPYGEGYDQRMMKGRIEYEEVYERGPRDSRAAREYFYDRDRKSFDRDSNESYERRSFGSGDLYGSLDSRGDYRDRDRYLSLDKSRSLRRGLRNAGSARLDDPDQDSEGEMVGGRRGDTNSLHRSSQNIRGKQHQVVDDEVWGVSMSGKPGWKRPSSASEQERRYNESRRMISNTAQVGSDGEKDRRFRKKSRTRSKEPDIRPGYATMRYPPRSKEDYFDFDADTRGTGSGGGMYDNDEEDDVGTGKIEPMDESPSYYGRRQPPPYYKPTTPRAEGRSLNDTLIAQEAKKMARYEYEEEAMRRMKKSNSRDLYFEGEEKERFSGKFGSGSFGNVTPPKSTKHVRMELEFEDFGDTPQSTTSGKFNFESGDGFESDFNSPPAPPCGGGQVPHHTTKAFRFSNDFSEKDPGRHYQAYHKGQPQSFGGFEADFSTAPRPTSTAQTASKLRFNENVTVSKFSSESATGSHMFEDDFAGRSDNELEDQWTPEMPAPLTNSNGGKKILKTSSQQQSQQHDNLRKSDSVNIFAKKVEDPFEDDDFFSSGLTTEKDPFEGNGGGQGGGETGGTGGSGGQSGWDKNFANFDDNI